MGKELVAVLSEQQMVFARECSRGVPPAVAASIAGYSVPGSAAQILKRNPQVQAAIASELRRFLFSEGAPAALNLMYRFMVDDKKDDKLRLACAKTIADRAGFIAPKAKENNSLADKGLGDLTRAELEEEAARIMKEISDRAITVIEHDQTDSTHNTQAIDPLD